MNFQPLGDRVAIRPEPRPQLKSGIVVLDGYQARLPPTGVVVAVGPGRLTPDGFDVIPLRVKVGDRVLFPPQQGVPCEVDGAACLLLFDGELFAIVDAAEQP